MDTKTFDLPYVVISNWEYGQADVEPFRTEDQAEDYMETLEGEAYIATLVDYKDKGRCYYEKLKKSVQLTIKEVENDK